MLKAGRARPALNYGVLRWPSSSFSIQQQTINSVKNDSTLFKSTTTNFSATYFSLLVPTSVRRYSTAKKEPHSGGGRREGLVLDIELFRKEAEVVKESQRRRFAPVELVDEILALDAQRKKARHNIDQMNAQSRQLSKQIETLVKEKGSTAKIEEIKEQSKALREAIREAEKDVVGHEHLIQGRMKSIGNIVHNSVPVSKDEKDNLLVRKWGDCKSQKGLKHHHELLWMIDGYDPERGVKVAGHRGYFLKGIGARLNQALISYGMDFLDQKNYTILQTPFMMNKDVMGCTAQLSQFDEELYKVEGQNLEEKYLIATSEQPISAYHAGEWLEEKSLPLRYAGVSTCFRKEAGAHGKDTWGIFRVHQFEKVEQFSLTTPETSWDEHERMLSTAEEFYQSLGLPYQVVSIVSGELNNAAAKKYDLEGWFPAFQGYRELVSASNCTDYQSRALEIRCGIKKEGEKKRYVHMLNATLCGTSRTISCILENYQTDSGVTVPPVLQPYLGGKEFIPFVQKEPPSTTTH